MRIGVLVDTGKLRGGRRAVFDQLLASSAMHVALLIHAKPGPKRLSQFVWDAIDWGDRWFAKALLHPALARARGLKATSLDRGALDLSTAGVSAVQSTEVDRVMGAELDLIINLSQARCDDLDPGLARHGIWRIATRRAPQDRSGPLRENWQAIPTCGSKRLGWRAK
jgi:hypothetical protein